jgi:hypothetical protein
MREKHGGFHSAVFGSADSRGTYLAPRRSTDGPQDDRKLLQAL